MYSPIISDKTFYANTAFVELVRGCPYECKFCPACWHNKPARYFDFASIKKAVKKAAKYAEKITFIGAMITAHPDFDELCIYLKKLKEKRNFKVEFSSLGFDKLCKYVPQLIDEKTISFAIECGSEEQRAKIGKNLSDEKIFKAFDYYINSDYQERCKRWMRRHREVDYYTEERFKDIDSVQESMGVGDIMGMSGIHFIDNSIDGLSFFL